MEAAIRVAVMEAIEAIGGIEGVRKLSWFPSASKEAWGGLIEQDIGG